MSAMRSAAAGLLAEVDLLAFPERMRLLALRAMALSGSGELDLVLDDLYGGDRFQRGVAVFMAVVAGHRPTIEVALRDQVWEIHRQAVGAWVRSGWASPGAVAGLVREASWFTRRHVYRLLRRLRAAAVADVVIEVVWERFGDREAARLLPACSVAVVTRLLPELGYAAGDWSLLGKLHPEVVLDVAEAQLAGLTEADRGQWWGRSGAGVVAAGTRFPLRVLDLLERYGPAGSLPGPLDQYVVLAMAGPGRLVKLMADPGRARWLTGMKLPGSLLRRLAALEPAALEPVARRLRRREAALVALLDAVPPARRAALYEAAYRGVDRGQARPSDQVLEALPRALRHAEASRVLGLGLVRGDAALTLHYIAFLPWEQAKAPLTDATLRAQADDRARGYELLLACADRTGNPETVTGVIGYLRRMRNEQDPVRARALAGLARVRAHLLLPQAGEALEQITADTLAARDASSQSRHALSTLAVTVLRCHAGEPPLMSWALRTLERIFGDQVPALGRIDTQLRHGQEHEFFEAVRDWLDRGLQRGSYQPLFATARALRRRAWKLPGLQDMLRRAVDPGSVSSVMREGITLWLADPATRSGRIEHVLAADPSAVTLGKVWAVLSRRRTDLLDQFLAGTPVGGKFFAAGVRWVPPPSPGTNLWLPRQQAAYAGLLAEVAADAGAKTCERTAAIAAAASAGDAGWDVVHRYLDSADTSLAEAALGALAWADRPGDTLPVLLSHAGDDQARVALYAAGRAARFIPPAELEPLLIAAPVAAGKVTARKVALRLAAALSVPGAGTILHQAWTQQGQHRDVRAAVAAAARQRLHDPASWPILGQAATGSPEEALAVVTAAGPLWCAPRYRRQYGQLIAQACDNSNQNTARAAWRALPGWAYWIPGVTALITARLTDLDDRILWQLAVPPLTTLLAGGQPGPVLRDVASQLAALDQASAGHEEPGRDRPARQRLATVIDKVATAARRAAPDFDRQAVADAGRQLARQPDFTRQAAALLIAAVHTQHGHGQQLAGELAEISDLLHDQPVAASRAAHALAFQVADDENADPDAIYAAAASLADDGQLGPGLFAAALARHGAKLGWPPRWRTCIRGLRAHPDPDVRAAALEIVMNPE
jgi:hypothetical protein